jgi:predicted O-methyltransferase YrrM
MKKNNLEINLIKKLLSVVLDKLQVAFNKKDIKNLSINFSDNVEKTLMDIENDEGKVYFEHNTHKKEFGQKHAGEQIKFWSLPKDSAMLLTYFIAFTKSKNILEIGTSVGYSTIHLACGVNSGTISTIENFPDKIKLAKKNFQKSNIDNIKLFEGNATDILENIQNIDFVFLDADKENYGKYFDQIISKLSVGGYIVADNIFDYGHMMQDFLQKVLGTKYHGSTSDPRVISYTLPIDNGLLFIRKISD